MNLILFQPSEVLERLIRVDPRAVHIIDVLKRKPGDILDVGIAGGPRGKAQIKEIDTTGIVFDFIWEQTIPTVDPIVLIIGLSRPQTMRKCLGQASTLGVKKMLFPCTDKGEPSYAGSSLWTTGEYKRHIVSGTEQAFSTQVPEVGYGMSLEDAVVEAGATRNRFALDNYEATIPLGKVAFVSGGPIVVAVGSERGWSGGERKNLVEAGFVLAHLGPRILRTETAVVATLAIIKSCMGFWENT